MSPTAAPPPSHGPRFHDDGVTFSVWAPHADDVRLVFGERETAMSPDADGTGLGWWTTTMEAADGDRYGFSIDGGPVRPDPASRRQPDGVHGMSALVDPRRLADHAVEGWDAPSLLDGVIYELHVGTFTAEGTFDAATTRLAALRELGVTHVEVMPVNAFNGTHGWGYDGVAWYAVHEPYGGPEGFARFVQACHSTGLAVILDVVHNHLGPSGNYLPEFGPYVSEGGQWGSGLNLDGPHADEVRSFIVGNAVTWLRDYHVDALRLDAVHALLDTSAVHILTSISTAVDALSAGLGRRLELVAESDRNDPKTIWPPSCGGNGMTAQWADELHHAIHSAVTGERDGYYMDYEGLPDVAAAYTKGFVYDGSRRSAFRQRSIGAPLGDADGRRLVGCIQNHDQVGNRAHGERLTTLTEPGLVRVAALLLCAAPHTPMLFMGEEHGETNPFQYFTSHPEPELAEAVRKGRAEEFAAFEAFSGQVPNPQDPDTVTRSTIDWSRADTEDGICWRSLWADLLRVRRDHPALSNGRRDLVTVLESRPDVLVVLRRAEDGSGVLLAANIGTAPVSLQVTGGGVGEVLVDTRDARYGGDGQTASATDRSVTVPSGSAAMWAVLG